MRWDAQSCMCACWTRVTVRSSLHPLHWHSIRPTEHTPTWRPRRRGQELLLLRVLKHQHAFLYDLKP